MSIAPPAPSLELLIADAVRSAKDSDSHDLAQAILDDLGDDQIRLLAAEALERSIRRHLRPSVSRGESGQIAPAVPRSTRWDLVTRAAESGDLDLARMTVETGAESKPLLGCLYLDLLNASDNHTAYAFANERFAEQYRKLADALLADDSARTVGDLSEETVRIFTGGESFTRREDAHRAIHDAITYTVGAAFGPRIRVDFHAVDLAALIVDLDENGDVIEAEGKL